MLSSVGRTEPSLSAAAAVHDELQLQVGLEGSLLLQHQPRAPHNASQAEPPRASVSTEGAATAAATNGPNQLLSAEQAASEQQASTSRPSSSMGGSSRFSTVVPGRAPSPADASARVGAAVPWTRGIASAAPTDPVDEPSAEGLHTSASIDASSAPPSLTISAGVDGTVSNPQDGAVTIPPFAVHDTDPPFMTDGRGRVVWSSATAGRGRRARAAAAAAAAAASNGTVAASSARDKPQGREQNQTEPPTVRPASSTRRESETRNS